MCIISIFFSSIVDLVRVHVSDRFVWDVLWTLDKLNYFCVYVLGIFCIRDYLASEGCIKDTEDPHGSTSPCDHTS